MPSQDDVESRDAAAEVARSESRTTVRMDKDEETADSVTSCVASASQHCLICFDVSARIRPASGMRATRLTRTRIGSIVQPFAAAAPISAQVVDNNATSGSADVPMRPCGHGICGICMRSVIKARTSSGCACFPASLPH